MNSNSTNQPNANTQPKLTSDQFQTQCQEMADRLEQRSIQIRLAAAKILEISRFS